MREKAEYKSALRSRRLIRQAFVELIAEKAFDKITVTDIVKRADINRGTFYAHYTDTRAIGQEMQNEVIEKLRSLLNELKFESFLQNPRPLLENISEWLTADMDYYRSLLQLRGAEFFLVKLKDIFVNLILTDTDIPESIKKASPFLIHAHFMAGGVISLYQAWLVGAIQNPIEEIAEELSKLLLNYSNPPFPNFACLQDPSSAGIIK